MTSRKEEERNEKIIRGLMKLPPNRKCINCNSLGPQYVCTNFWTFVCTACSGIHREFTHRVKSVSMAKFTSLEVDALQKGGNQRAREIFLKDWDTQLQRLPDCSNVDRIREFIKNVYVDRKYAGGGCSDKPPKDMQSQKNYEDDTRRANSYHSYSQSPPYENQYEDRRYHKQAGVLTRKPGSDRGLHEGKISSFIYSPGRSEQIYEDRFANEGSVGRASDYSVSSASEPFRHDPQSPNFQKDTGFSSPSIQAFRDIIIDHTGHQTMNVHPDVNFERDRTLSSGSSASFNSNSMSLKTVNSGNLLGVVIEPKQSILVQQAGKSTFPSLPQTSSSAGVVSQDPFNPTFEETTSSATKVDLSANPTHQNSLATSLERNPPTCSSSENVGWATFDLIHSPPPAASNSEAKYEPQASMSLVHGKGDPVLRSSVNGITQRASVQSPTTHVPYPLTFNQWNRISDEVQTSTSQRSAQSWNAFGNSTVNMSHASFESLLQKSEPQIPVYAPPSGRHTESSEVSMDLGIEFQRSTIEDLASSLPFSGVIAGSSFPSSIPPMGGSLSHSHDQKPTNPFDLMYDSDLEHTTMFLDMSSLQTALPKAPFPVPFVGGVPEQWFPQSSAMPFIDSVQQGGLTYALGQAPTSPLLNDQSQGPVASFGGNPFA